ncbi:MFS transporter [Paenibacillus albiflavus]|nr:MFS transporter [Paenibacillus albiflavus]
MKKAFRYLWIGQSFANIADLFYIVGLITIIYARTGSAVYMAILPFTITCAAFVGGLFIPLLIDRFVLTKILVYSQLGKTIVLLFLVLFISEIPLVFLFALVMIISLLDAMATPASHSMIPILMNQDELIKANSFLSIVDQTIQLGGWAVGGMVVALIGATNIVWLTLGLFTLSTIMMSLIRVKEPAKDKKDRMKPWASLQEGWILLWSNKALKVISINVVIESIAYVVWIAAIIYVYVEQVLHETEEWWGYINASFMFGLLIGGFFMLKRSKQFESHKKLYLALGSFICFAATFVFGILSLPWLALFISFVFGIAEQVKGISMQTITQQAVAVNSLPKIYSAHGALSSISFGTASLVMGLLTDAYGARFVFMISAGLMFISFLVIQTNMTHLVKNKGTVDNQAQHVKL